MNLTRSVTFRCGPLVVALLLGAFCLLMPAQASTPCLDEVESTVGSTSEQLVPVPCRGASKAIDVPIAEAGRFGTPGNGKCPGTCSQCGCGGGVSP